MVCNNYERPEGVMGGPCINCGASQPEHGVGEPLVIPGLLEKDRKGIPRYTPEGLIPFTNDDAVKACVDNVFSKGEVAVSELEPGFIGWTVIGQRPLSAYEIEPGIIVATHGAGGAIFASYQEALDICVRSHQYSTSKGWDWLDRGKYRVFSMVIMSKSMRANSNASR